jgi:hypothetical protein
MSGATEEVNVKLINFGGTDGIEADVMIDNTTYKIKVSQDDINTAVEKSLDGFLEKEFDSDAVNRVKAIPQGDPINLVEGMGSETIEEQQDNLLMTRMQELSSYLHDYKESYKFDLENYQKNMKGGSNDLSIPLSVALSVLNNELKTVSPSSTSTEDKEVNVKELNQKVDELVSVSNEIQPLLKDFINIDTVGEKIKETITNTNNSIKDIDEFKETYELGETILSEVVDLSGIKVNE